jgi:hypothetical protein
MPHLIVDLCWYGCSSNGMVCMRSGRGDYPRSALQAIIRYPTCDHRQIATSTVFGTSRRTDPNSPPDDPPGSTFNCDPVPHDRDGMADLCPRFIHLNLGAGQGRQKRCLDGAQHVFSQPADDGTVTTLRICLHSQHHWYLDIACHTCTPLWYVVLSFMSLTRISRPLKYYTIKVVT